ncbi:hypothetical protein QJS10_CPA02g00363 [Acorus calamus]|uniref:Uncharacterized protein n=1 Tax=Acorus calamus TaxID=4465 RepID=A0AAV9FCE9_ACOCL|nr:hypothetical protein QJS10_CPA02g00363 [Acorus calamus]
MEIISPTIYRTFSTIENRFSHFDTPQTRTKTVQTNHFYRITNSRKHIILETQQISKNMNQNMRFQRLRRMGWLKLLVSWLFFLLFFFFFFMLTVSMEEENNAPTSRERHYLPIQALLSSKRRVPNTSDPLHNR